MDVKWEVIKFFIKRALARLIEKIKNIFVRKVPSPKPPEDFEVNEKIKDIGP